MSKQCLSNLERLKQLETLLATPMTYEEICEVTGMSESMCRQHVDKLHDDGRIHIDRWTDVGRKRLLKQFKAGRAPDAPRPANRFTFPSGTVMANVRSEKCKRMLQVERLLTKPMSSYEVADVTGFAKPSVRTYLRELHDIGRVHIGGWRVGGKVMTKLYLAGEGEDAPKPANCKDGEDEDEIFKRGPIVVRICRDPLVAALFGEALEKVREAA